MQSEYSEKLPTGENLASVKPKEVTTQTLSFRFALEANLYQQVIKSLPELTLIRSVTHPDRTEIVVNGPTVTLLQLGQKVGQLLENSY